MIGGGGVSDGTEYSARVFRNATQAIVTATLTSISFDTESEDVGGFWAVGTPTIFTIPVAGVYAVSASISWALNAVGTRLIELWINNATSAGRAFETNAGAVDANAQVTAIVRRFAAGDTIATRVYQTSGGNLNIATATEYSPIMAIAKVKG